MNTFVLRETILAFNCVFGVMADFFVFVGCDNHLFGPVASRARCGVIALQPAVSGLNDVVLQRPCCRTEVAPRRAVEAHRPIPVWELEPVRETDDVRCPLFKALHGTSTYRDVIMWHLIRHTSF